MQVTIEKIRAKYISTLNQFYHANRGVTNKFIKVCYFFMTYANKRTMMFADMQYV